MRLLRFDSYPVGDPATEAAVAYYRELFGPEDLPGTIAGMEPGDSGYTAYHAATMYSDGRLLLSPLFRVTPEQTSPSETFVMRQPEGYTIDFRPREVRGRDRFYEEVVSAEVFSDPADNRPLGIPVLDVIGEPDQIPGYFCDENGQPPSPGPNGEHYGDFDEVDQFHDVRKVYRDLGVAIPDAFRPPFPGDSKDS